MLSYMYIFLAFYCLVLIGTEVGLLQDIVFLYRICILKIGRCCKKKLEEDK